MRSAFIMRHLQPFNAIAGLQAQTRYRYDVTLGGSESQVAHDIEDIRRKVRDIGLQLNDST